MSLKLGAGVIGAFYIFVLAAGPAFVARAAKVKMRRPVPLAQEAVDLTAPEPLLVVHAPVVVAETTAPAPKPVVKAAVVAKAKPEPTPDLVAIRAAVAGQLETLPICRRSDGPEGPGLAEVTFFSDAHARVELSAPYANTAAGACVARRLAAAAQPFDGPPVTVRLRFEL